jgi:hypothetical protein
VGSVEGLTGSGGLDVLHLAAELLAGMYFLHFGDL